VLILLKLLRSIDARVERRRMENRVEITRRHSGGFASE